MENFIWVLNRLRNHLFLIFLALLGVILESIGTSGVSLLVKNLVDSGILLKDGKSLILTTTSLLGLALVQQVGNFLVFYHINKCAEKDIKDIRELVFKKLLNSSFLSVRGYSMGDYTTRVLSDLRIYRDMIESSVVKLIRDPITAILLFGVLLYRDWTLTLFLLLLLPFIILSVEYFGRKKGKHLRRSQEFLGQLITKMGDVFKGYESLRTLPSKNLLLDWFRGINQKAYRASSRIVLYTSLNSVFNYSLGYVVVALLLLYGGFRVLQGALTLGDLLSYLTALILIQKPIMESQKGVVEVRASLPVVERIREVLNLEEEKTSGEEFKGLKEGIRVDNLSLTMGDRAVLSGVSFSVKKGEKLAVMGGTGSGKSSLLRALCGFVPYEGEVFYDQKELKEWNLASLRRRIAYLTQESFVLAGSVRENLLIAKPDAKEEEMWRALNLACCDFVQDLEEEVDKESRMLSGGEAQRLSLARVFLKEPDILLLDEATSALDANTERLVLKNLFEHFPSATFIVVAHRLSNILACDRALIIREGKVVFDGDSKRAVETFISENL
ncbi:ABC transporter ATP-binding protein [Thermocrinis sp.]